MVAIVGQVMGKNQLTGGDFQYLTPSLPYLLTLEIHVELTKFAVLAFACLFLQLPMMAVLIAGL